MDPLIAKRLLDPQVLMECVSQNMSLNGARLLSASARDIDAPGYLSDLVGVTLSWDRSTDAPIQAVLKVSHSGFGQQELPFYARVASSLNCAVVPRFYAGGVDEPSGRTWLLIEDFSGSHERPSEAPLPPTFARCTSIVEGLARFHAAGREASSACGADLTMWERLQSSEWLEPACNRLIDQAGDALPAGAQHLYERFIQGFPSLLERAEQFHGRTLIHGDAHVWNWMLPRDGAVSVPKLIDWDGWQWGVGVWDLAYMMALQWDRDVCQRFESPLLDRYHAALTAYGAAACSRAALQEDYRLAVLLHLRTPVARFARGMSAYVWWPQLTRIQQAVEDLGCVDLLS